MKTATRLVNVLLIIVTLLAGFFVAKDGIVLAVLDRITDVRYPSHGACPDGVIPVRLMVAGTDGDSISIAAWRCDATDSLRRVVIVTHGIADSTGLIFLGHAREWARQGIATVMVDLRAHGASEGDKLGLACLEWMEHKAAREYVGNDSVLSHVPVVYMGVSMGAATAINAAARSQDVDKVVALSPFSSVRDIAASKVHDAAGLDIVPRLEPYFTAMYGSAYGTIAPVRSVEDYSGRMLIVRSEGDRVVPACCTDTLVAHNNSINVLTLPGDNHMIVSDYSNPRRDSLYWNTVTDFILE